MDPTIGGIIAASIVGVGSIIGNIIQFLFLRTERRNLRAEREKTNGLLEGSTKALETVREEAEKRYGYGYGAKCVKSKATIEDLEGKTHIIREFYGVGVVTEDMRLPAFSGEVAVGAPGTIVNKPQLLHHLDRPDFRKQIELVPEDFGERCCKFRIEVEGGLTKADGDIDYGYEWSCSRAVCMTKEEAVETYASDLFRKEYYCVDVRFPIDELEIEIEFPQGYMVRTFPGVFLGGSETWHDLELQRIKEDFKQTPGGACLKVSNPKIGFRYIIFWTPLSRREVEQLRST